MLNIGPVSECSKYQSTIAFSLIEARYVILTLAAKEATWLWLLLIILGLLLLSNQFAKIKIMKGSRDTRKIKANLRDQKEKDNESIVSKVISIYFSILLKAILLKGDNQILVALVYNLIYYTWTKQIDI